jgi:hypothetical protein
VTLDLTRARLRLLNGHAAAHEETRLLSYMTRRDRGHIYFARCGDRVKIGFASDVPHRIRTLQIGCPDPITVLLLYPATRRDEATLHKRFKKYRQRGEWFRLVPAITSYIAERQA